EAPAARKRERRGSDLQEPGILVGGGLGVRLWQRPGLLSRAGPHGHRIMESGVRKAPEERRPLVAPAIVATTYPVSSAARRHKVKVPPLPLRSDDHFLPR